MSEIDRVHQRAVSAVKNLKRCEREVIDALIEVDEKRVFKEMGYSSLHDYCVMALNLSHDQAYTYIGIARKSREVPELRQLVNDGSIHLTNAKKIVRVLTPENKTELLEKAKDLSSRQLERELIKTYPEKVTKERIRPVTENRLEMKVFITPELEKNLRRMQDVLSQKLKKPCTMEEVVTFMATECLERHDPVKKAERAKPKVVARPKSDRRAIPVQVAHQVVKRDHGQCTFILPNGQRCPSTRWLQTHHRTPWAQGGAHSVENLTTLCFTHHSYIHDRGPARAKTNPFRAGPMAR